jgi:hypothetical protein
MARVGRLIARSRVSFAVLAAALVLAAAPPAHAALERSIIEDRNDVNGLFDVAEARYVHEVGVPPHWRITTYASWRPRQVWDAGFVWIELDTRYDEGSDYYALVRADRDKLVGGLFRIARDPGVPDPRVSSVGISRSSPQDVVITIPLTKMLFGERRTTFRWWVETTFVSDRCPTTCVDTVPDRVTDAVSQDAPGGPLPGSLRSRPSRSAA